MNIVSRNRNIAIDTKMNKDNHNDLNTYRYTATYSHPKAPTVWSFFGFYFRLDGTWVRLLLMLWWYVLTTLHCILVLDIFGNFSGTCESRSLGAFAIIFTLQTGGPTGNVSIRCFKQSKSCTAVGWTLHRFIIRQEDGMGPVNDQIKRLALAVGTKSSTFAYPRLPKICLRI